MELEGKVVLVTGASSGIGAALARRLAAGGSEVVAAARRLELLEELGAAACIRADLSDPADALRMAEEALDRFGRVDVLVNNAGVRIDAAAVDAGLEELDESFQVNVLSPMVLAARLVPGMIERGEGAVANVLAPQVSPGRRGMGAYAASKAALESFTQTLRQEVGGGTGVAVFGFDPGWVRTDLAPDGSDDPDAAAARLEAAIARGRSSRDILS
ncbi:MAG: SDR family NAD(P)-dependent oxidoreductase [Solirubrobacterales bacterium]